MEKCRYIALTDINPGHLPWTEKDDIQSLIRLLLYSNEIDLEGIILCSSCFLKKGGGERAVKLVNQILDVYAAVKPNLDCHASGYPSAEKLRKTLCLGIPVFGKGLGSGFGEKRWIDNPGVQQIIRAVDAPDPRPVWVGLWGGANTLAQAIWQISRSRSPEQVSTFLKKLRIHSISDQDYAGTWLRQQFGGELFYIVTPCEGSRKGAREYYKAVWPGISGDCNGHGSENGQDKGGFGGAETALISKAWLDRNIRRIGPLGKCYPRTVFLSEGDTPAYLGLIPNGLNTPEHPDWGGWAGRYQLVPSPERAPVWSGSADTVIGTDGNIHRSPQASLWRWRRAFQLDFAARMAWTVCAHYEECAHPPVIRLSCPCICHVQPGQTVRLDAAASVSPDDSPLRLSWYWYPEAGNSNILPQLTQTVGSRTEALFASPGIFHLILEAMSEGVVHLTRYARVVFICEESERNHGH